MASKNYKLNLTTLETEVIRYALDIWEQEINLCIADYSKEKSAATRIIKKIFTALHEQNK